MPKEYTLIGGNGTVVSPLEVTEDGDYVAGDSRAFNPVRVRTGGGGSSTLSGLTDVDISNPTDGQTLVYDAASQKWENGAGGVLNIVDNLGTLDKTYNEIRNAFLGGKKCIIITETDDSEPDNIYISTSYVDIVSVDEEEAGEPGQTSMSYGIMLSDGRLYTTDSENGYPGSGK